mgnify:CR=1 FL=1
MLPWSTAGEESTSATTALFTAASAVCVTGLVVVDTGTYWSPLGQGLVMALFQLGGALLHAAFEGDLTAALVLGTIGQHYIQRFYDEQARDSAVGLDRLVDGGEHLSRVRACNAMSVSSATGIPRETVRRKVRWLVSKKWVAVGARGQLTLVPGMSSAFEEFDLETIARFHAASRDFLRQIEHRASAPRAMRGAGSR